MAHVDAAPCYRAAAGGGRGAPTHATQVGRDGRPHPDAAPAQALADGELDVEQRDALEGQGDDIGDEEGACRHVAISGLCARPGLGECDMGAGSGEQKLSWPPRETARRWGFACVKAMAPHCLRPCVPHPLGLCGVPIDTWAELLSHWGPDTPGSRAPGMGSWSAHSGALQEGVTRGPPSCTLGWGWKPLPTLHPCPDAGSGHSEVGLGAGRLGRSCLLGRTRRQAGRHGGSLLHREPAWTERVPAGGRGSGVPEPTGLLGRRGSPWHAPTLSGGLSPQKRNQPCVCRWRLSRTSPVHIRETRLLWACACGCFSDAWLTVAAAHAHPGPVDPREQHRPSGPDQQHGYSGHGSPHCPQEVWAQPTRATPMN